MSATDDDHELLNGMPLTEIVHGTALEKAAPYRAFAEVWARELEAERWRCPVRHVYFPVTVTIRGRTTG